MAAASLHPVRPRLLVITERLPRPDESSGSRRLLAILTALARQADVDLWVELDESEGPRRLPARRVAADRQRLADAGVPTLPTGWRALRHVLDTPYDMVIAEFYHVAARYLPVLRDEHPGAAMVVDSVDLHYARLAAGVAAGAVDPNWARDVYAEETAVYRAADAVVVVSADDSATLGREDGMPPVIYVPNAVVIRPRAVVPRGPEAVFVGHFHHAPNLDGIRWFVEHAWPRVRRRHPDALLSIIGSYASAEVHALGRAAGVTVVGYVPDIAPHLDRAAVALAPLRFGAGMKGKVTDALAAGVPVVTTSIGAQGLDLVHRRHAWIADDAEAFAEAVSEAFAAPEEAAAIGAAGQQHIAGICGPAALVGAIDDLLRVRRTDGRAVVRGGLRRRLRRVRLACGLWGLTFGRRIAGWRTAQRHTGLTGAVVPPA